MTVFLLGNVITAFAVLWSQTYYDNHEVIKFDWSTLIASLLLTLFILLVLSVTCLVSRMKKRRDQLCQDQSRRDVFDREINILWGILALFSVTYLVRASWDFIFQEDLTGLWQEVTDLSLGLLWDWLPIIVLLFQHYRAFNIRVSSEASNED